MVYGLWFMVHGLWFWSHLLIHIHSNHQMHEYQRSKLSLFFWQASTFLFRFGDALWSGTMNWIGE
jgi:Na+/H+ antiporter NhaB